MGIENPKGFTLIEVLTALFITSIVSISVYSLFISFQRNFNQMIIISDMQHNTKSALENILATFKTAGCDPNEKIFSISYPPIRKADKDSIHFEMDITDEKGDGEPDGMITGTKESIIYSLYDSGNDGDLDLGRKKEGGRNAAVAENIEKLGFFYFDKDLNQLNEPIDKGSIVTVLVAVLGRSSKELKDYKNWNEYMVTLPNGQKISFFKSKGDSYKRYLLSTIVYLNNRK